MNNTIDTGSSLAFAEQLVCLSVDLHTLNSSSQRLLGLSLVQWSVLRKILKSPAISAGTLAEESKIHPSTLTPTLNRLESMGLIYVFERPKDLRRKMIVISRAGFELCAQVEKRIALIFGVQVPSKSLEHVSDFVNDSVSEMNRFQKTAT
ncbi:MAG: MarR family transcriptional regulator [Silvanigrellaceae bacterium]